MSEPSPEAKQTEQIARDFHDTYERLAPQFGYETRTDTKQFDPASPNGKLMQAVCSEVVDRATAKLREELEQTRENLYAGLDRDRDDITTPHLATVAVNALALAREELETSRVATNELLRQLAHQQPSAITTNEQAYRDGTLSQPSAPTAERPCTCHPDDKPPVPCTEKYALSECKAPTADVEKWTHETVRAIIGEPSTPADVEKIARELWAWAECSNDTELKTILDYFAQARAPLVEALKLAEIWLANSVPIGEPTKEKPLPVIRAVLTGTGEKLSPEGPVTTNKKEISANAR